jgi:hypothetical protein
VHFPDWLACRGQRRGGAFRTRYPDPNCIRRNAQSSAPYEFYAAYDLPHRLDKLQGFVDAFAHRYNRFRPYAALGGLTLAQHLARYGGGGPTRVSYLMSPDSYLTKLHLRMMISRIAIS